MLGLFLSGQGWRAAGARLLAVPSVHSPNTLSSSQACGCWARLPQMWEQTKSCNTWPLQVTPPSLTPGRVAEQQQPLLYWQMTSWEWTDKMKWCWSCLICEPRSMLSVQAARNADVTTSLRECMWKWWCSRTASTLVAPAGPPRPTGPWLPWAHCSVLLVLQAILRATRPVTWEKAQGLPEKRVWIKVQWCVRSRSIVNRKCTRVTLFTGCVFPRIELSSACSSHS